MQIECAYATSHKLERKNDMFLMDEACAKTKDKLCNSSIRTINYCRSYLVVKCLSDIYITDGHYILPSVMEGQQSVSHS